VAIGKTGLIPLWILLKRNILLKKIVVIGPESTGKSTLCKQLAEHYKTSWCPEYAREYLLTHGKEYSYDDLFTIAKGQLALEDEHVSRLFSSAPHSPLATPHSPLFIDTNMYVMKVWCEFVFGKCHRYILDQIKKRKYDLYLLCSTDLPWVKDELREYPDLHTRQQLYHIYREIMINQPVPWIDIAGNNEERLQKAITAVDMLLKN
jgi:NadR type nicotinamide-nucleotide adenylyltransferase